MACVGFFGALRTSELAQLTFDHVKQDDEGVWISFDFATKTEAAGSDVRFLLPISKEPAICPIRLLAVYKQELGPALCTGRFFKSHRGHFIDSPVGKNSLAQVPRRVAEFLRLPNSEKYTSHTWRRSSATAYADSGASTEKLKRLGCWKSQSVASSYVDSSMKLVKDTANALAGPQPSETTVAAATTVATTTTVAMATTAPPRNTLPTSLVLENCQNCTIVFGSQQ